MTSLKAFIGHSFTADDETVVRSFLKYFDQIAGFNIGFEWEHAESAEPRDLAEKVLRLMEGKNLFIGICTKKEATISVDKLSVANSDEPILELRHEHILWKTSDWIIQEIGLAIGKGMELILLVEQGVQQPGSLQGNREYITFDREAPEKTFGKILEMISSLLPKARVPIAETSGTLVPLADKTDEAERKNEDWSQPKEDWKREDYGFVWMHKIATDDAEGADKISRAYLETTEGQSLQNRESWRAYQEYYRLALGKGGKLTSLDEMARAYPENSDVLQYQAMGYRKFGEQDKAARHFEVAATKAAGEKQRLACYGDAALAYTRASKKAEANRVIEVMKQIAPTVEDGEEQLVRTMRSLAEAEDDKESFFGLTERLLDICPGEVETRFSLAFKYSEENQDGLSLYHYLKIPFPQRDPVTWNNLGVQLSNCKLVAKSIAAYRNSMDLGQTLAMSNLAQKFIGAGFLKEAEEVCKQAVKTENYHKNVGYAITRIKELAEEEEKSEAEIIKSVNPVSDFYKDYGRAITESQIGNYRGRWRGPDCELEITIKGNTFVAEGSYEQSILNSLALLLAAAPPTGPSHSKVRYLVKYEGEIIGRAIRAVFTRKKEGEAEAPRTILGVVDKGKDTLLVIDESLKSIRGYEKNSAREKQFFTFSCIT